YDLGGFHTREWLDSFLDYLRTQTDARIDADDVIHHEGRTIHAIVCPIGIDTEDVMPSADGETSNAMRETMIASANGRAMIVGVDRLDYSKGLADRFLGYERLLAARPDLHEQIFLLQIAPPSRADVQSYQEIRASLDSLSGRINGEY